MGVRALQLRLGVEGVKMMRESTNAIAVLMAELVEEETMSRNASILCVYEDPAVMHSTQLVLRTAGHHVCVASNVADAFLLLKVGHFDMLVLDCIPAFTWLAVEAKRMHRKLRVAVCTGDPRCSQLPFVDAVLYKPLPPPVFLERIAELLDDAESA